MTYLSSQSGFSLVEMLVAVSVLLIIIVGPMTVTSRVAKSSSFASEQVQAFFLAQEGLELAEKVRDDFLLRNLLPPSNPQYPTQNISDPWGRFVNTGGTYANCHAATGCGLAWDTATALAALRDCSPPSNNCKIYYKPSAARSKFTHDSSGTVENTPFTRVIRFENQGATAVKVTSTVTWRTGSIATEQKVETSTYLYNIYAKN